MKKQTRKPVARQAASNKKRASKREISGFSTLTQVSGIPAQHKHHSALEVDEPKSVVEPNVCCELCGERIETIASAMTTAIGGYAHFDCVLDHLRKLEKLGDDEGLSYIGSGNFGVITKDEDGKFHITRTINWESPERQRAMKDYVEGLKK